jgi:hypothetical protein
MGISIFAKGRIDRIEDIPQLVDELKTRAVKENWTYAILRDDFKNESLPVMTRTAGEVVISGKLGLQGIVLTIDAKVESLAIVFEREGFLTSVMQQLLDPAELPEKRLTFCKTQFGGIDAHISIIGILDLLRERYISNLLVEDEGGYWGSRDRGTLTNAFNVFQHNLDHAQMCVSGVKIAKAGRSDGDKVTSAVEQALLEEKKMEVLH